MGARCLLDNDFLHWLQAQIGGNDNVKMFRMY